MNHLSNELVHHSFVNGPPRRDEYCDCGSSCGLCGGTHQSVFPHAKPTCPTSHQSVFSHAKPTCPTSHRDESYADLHRDESYADLLYMDL